MVSRLLTLTLLAAAAATLSFALPAAAAPPCGPENMLAGLKTRESHDFKGDPKLVTDGIAAPEGSQWDAPITVTFGSAAGSITYDLGEPRPISAVVLQADANDTYKITGSLDGSAGSYKPLVEMPNVVGKGHGLRTRAEQFPPVTARYLRIGEMNGDGFFSISELAAYCKPPTPFPPPMRVVDVPPPPGSGMNAEPKPGKDTGPAALLLTIIAFALVWLAYKMVLPRPPEPPKDAHVKAEGKGEGKGEGGGDDGKTKDAPAKDAPADPADKPSK
jgi:hypothetical protein